MLTEIKLKRIYTDGVKLFRGVGWCWQEGHQIVYEEVVPYTRWIGTNSYGGYLTSVKKVKGNKMYYMTVIQFSKLMNDPTKELVQGIIKKQDEEKDLLEAR